MGGPMADISDGSPAVESATIEGATIESEVGKLSLAPGKVNTRFSSKISAFCFNNAFRDFIFLQVPGHVAWRAKAHRDAALRKMYRKSHQRQKLMMEIFPWNFHYKVEVVPQNIFF